MKTRAKPASRNMDWPNPIWVGCITSDPLYPDLIFVTI
jgi:hypothetical protein